MDQQTAFSLWTGWLFTHMILVGDESFMEKHPSEIPQYFNKWRSNEKWNLQESSVLMDESRK